MGVIPCRGDIPGWRIAWGGGLWRLGAHKATMKVVCGGLLWIKT